MSIEEAKISIRSISKRNLLIVALSALVLRVVPLMRPLLIEGFETINSLLIAARLAGLEWLYVADSFTYHGQLYNAIFAPLFMWTDNPFTIYLSILLFNAALMTLLSTVIYVISVKYMKLPDRYPTALLAAFCAGALFTGDATLISTEIPIVLIVWLSALMLLIAVNSSVNKQNTNTAKMLATFGLAMVLCIGMIMHQRMEVLAIVIGVVTLIYFFAFKAWVITPGIFYTLMLVLIPVARGINLVFAGEIMPQMGFSEIVRAAIAPTGILQHGFSPRVLLYTVITNATAVAVHTHGLAVMAALVFLFLLFMTMKRLVIERVRSDENIGISREQFVIISVFASTIIIILFASYADIRAVVFPLFGPMIPATFGYIYSNLKEEPNVRSKVIVNMCYVAIGGFVLTYLYVMLLIFPAIEENLLFSHILVDDLLLPQFSGGLPNVYATFMISTAFFIALCFAVRIRKSLAFAIPIYAFAFSLAISNMSAHFFHIEAHDRRMSRIYRHLEDIKLPEEIYFSHDIENDYEVQFLFNRKSIVRGIPKVATHDAVYIGTYPIGGAHSSIFRMSGFAPYFFPGHAEVWIRGDYMRKGLIENAVAHDLEHSIIDPRVEYLIAVGDAENIYLADSVVSLNNIWVYQSKFNMNIVSPFISTNNLFDQDMENNVIFALRNDDVFVFSTRLVLDELLIVTENQQIIESVLALGGEIVSGHSPDVISFEASDLTVLMRNGGVARNMSWFAPEDRMRSPIFALPSGHYQVTFYGRGLSDADFRASGVRMTSTHESDSLITFTFMLEHRKDFMQFMATNMGDDFILIEGIKLHLIERQKDYLFKINLNSTVYFVEGYENYHTYNLSGLSAREGFGIWSLGHRTEFLFNIADAPGDVVFSFTARPFVGDGLSSQRVEIEVNGELLEVMDISEGGEYSALIPASLFRDTGLNIVFNLPTATSPYAMSMSGDARNLALLFERMVFREVPMP